MANFRTKLTATVLPVVFLGFAVSTAVAVTSAAQAQDAAAVGKGADVTSTEAARVDGQTRGAQQAAVTLAAVASDLRTPDRSVLRSQIAEVTRSTEGIVDAYVDFVAGHAPGSDAAWRRRPGMTESGRFVTEYLRHGTGPAEPFAWDDATTLEAEKQQWFVGPMTTGRLTTAEPYVDPGSHILMTSFTARITDAAGQPAGVAGVDVPLDQLSRQVGETKVGEQGYAVLLSCAGVVLGAPARHGGTPDVIGAKSLTQAVQAGSLATARSILDGARAARGGSLSATDLFGSEPALITWTTVPSTSWTLVTVIPKAEIEAPVLALRTRLLITALVVLLAVAGVVVLVAARLTRRLPHLRDAALRIADGRLDDVELPERGTDELGELSMAFAAIVTSLRGAREKVTRFDTVQALADADELTGIANRRRFFQLAAAQVAAAGRAEQPLLALMVDIDLFKQVNDTFGHATGDDVIRTVADRLASQIRSADLIGRYGGEEFALLLPDASTTDVLPERLRACIADHPIQTRTGPVRVTVSIGLAALSPGDDVGGLLDRADQALYRAKQSGRNRVLSG